MEENKKTSKKTAIKIIIFVLLIIMLLGITDGDLKKNGKSKIRTQEGSCYLAEKNGKFIEITSDGDIYEHDFKGKAKCIEKDSDIIFLEESSDSYDYKSQLIIKKNGDIYISSSHDYKGKIVGNVKGAVSGVMSKYHIAILTKNGEVYVYGNNKYKALGIKDVEVLNEFTKVENIPKVKKLICEDYNTFVISYSGEIYGCGIISNNKYENYKKFIISNKVTNIDSFGNNVVALDERGNIYELGNNLYDTSNLKEYLEFNKIDESKCITSISEGYGYVVTLDKNKRIDYWGCKNVGKAALIPVKGKIKGVKNVKDIFCRGNYIYVLTDKNVYRYKLKK